MQGINPPILLPSRKMQGLASRGQLQLAVRLLRESFRRPVFERDIVLPPLRVARV